MSEPTEESHGNEAETDPAEAPDPDAVAEGDAEDVAEGDARAFDPYANLAYEADETDALLTAEDRALRAEDQMKNGHVGEALQGYREAVRTAADEESNASHRVTLGDAYAYSGQALNAYRQYRRAIKMSPRKAEPHFSLAELSQRYG